MFNSENTYISHHYEHVLLRSDYVAKNIEAKAFYADQENNTELKFRKGNDSPFKAQQEIKPLTPVKDQIGYVECLSKKFCDFKIIKIESPTKVKIVSEFTFPSYESKQRLFFSQDCKFMIEELEYKRMVFYEWFPTGETEFGA